MMNWLKKLMHYNSELVKKIDYDNNIGRIEDKITIITGLTNTVNLIAVEHMRN